MVCSLRHVLSHSFSLSLATIAIATAAPAAPAHADYLPLVRAYADAMIHNGRDTYGREHSPLFAAALDRPPVQKEDAP